MSNLRFVEKLANAPWLCQPEYVEFMHGILVRHLERQDTGLPLDRKAIEAVTGRTLENTRQVTIRDGVARIPVEGAIFRRANLFTEISGAVSTEQLATDFSSAHDDPTVHSILFVFDSPGGEAHGINELAGMIRQKRDLGEKRIESYVDGDCASGAYWLASATSRITVDAMAVIGSIGVVSRVRNPEALSQRDTMEFWSRSSPKKRLDFRSYEGQDAIQRYVDSLGDVFVAAVADNRGVSAEKVEEDFGQGFVMVGAEAVEAGLADDLGSEEGVIASLGARQRSLAAGKVRPAVSIPRATITVTNKEERVTEQANGQALEAEPTEQSARGIIARIRDLLGGAAVEAAAEDNTVTIYPDRIGAVRPVFSDTVTLGGEVAGEESDDGTSEPRKETDSGMSEEGTEATMETTSSAGATTPQEKESNPTPNLSAEVERLRSELNTEREQASKDREEVARLRYERELAHYEGRAKAAGMGSGDEARAMAEVLYRLDKGEAKEGDLETVLAHNRALAEQVKQGQLFSVIQGNGAQGGSAFAEATTLAREKVGKGEATSVAAARAQVWRERPDLKERYDAEQAETREGVN